MNESAQAKPIVAVIGGSYAGVSVAKSLDDVAEVKMIEPKDAFVHTIAALRALVDPSWLPRIHLPYSGLLKHGKHIRDRAAKVDIGRIELASGGELRADYIVLATGATYPFPAKTDLDDTSAAHEKIRAAHAALAAAPRVLLLGAGPVGIELAGEIKSVWPTKHVTLLGRHPDLLGPRFRPELKAELRRQLNELDVHLVLGTALTADPPGEPGTPSSFTALTETGMELTADIWYRCHGVKPNSDYLTGPLAAARQPDGSVEVTPHLQVTGQNRVFALGDVSTADDKMGGAAVRQAEIVASNIHTLITGEAQLRRYEPQQQLRIVVPLGPEGGAGQQGTEALLPAATVADLKGRDMMLPRFAALLNVPTTTNPTHE